MKEIRIFAFADEADSMIDGQIKALNENNLAGLEIRNVDGVNVSDITVEKAKEVKKKLDNAGLITWSVGSPIGKIKIENDDFNAHLEKFKRTLEIASVLDAENIRLFSFYIPKDKNPALYKNEVLDRLGKFCEIAKDSKITLCHENEKAIYGDNAERCLEILTALPEIRGIFDPANFVQCGVDTLDAWNLLKPYIKYMHIKDALENSAVVPCGKGIGNLPAILRDYFKNGGQSVTIEPHLTVFKGLSSLEQEGRASKVGTEYSYPSSEEAFKAAADALFETLGRI